MISLLQASKILEAIDHVLHEGPEKVSFLKKEFELFWTATEKDDTDDKVKVAILLRVISPRGIDIYENLKFDAEGDDMKYETVIRKFDGYCTPRIFLFIERHKVMNMKQDGLSVEQLETKLEDTG